MEFPLLLEAKNEIIKFLSALGIKSPSSSTSDLLSYYFNIQNKLITKKKRKVFLSSHIVQKAQGLSLGPILKSIRLKFIAGEDVNPFLSKGSMKAEDYDLLLNEWEIHHLHMNDKKKKATDYFHARAGFLLFIHIANDEVYFIDIRQHNEPNVFATKELLRAIRDNWSHIHSEFLLGDGSVKSTHPLSEEEISYLRKERIGLLYSTEVDGQTYLPLSGSATSGYSIKAGRQMDKFIRELHRIQQYLDLNKKLIQSHLECTYSKKFKSFKFSVILEKEMFYVYEKNSGYRF